MSMRSREIEYCSYCPKLCRFACPVAEVERSETVTPTGKATLLKLVNDGVVELTAEVAEKLYHCTGCLICRTYCEHDIELYPLLRRQRISACNRRIAPEAATKFREQWRAQRNPFGKDLSGAIGVEPGRPGAPVVLFVGCSTARYFPEMIGDAIKVLRALRVDFRVHTGEVCCGQPLLALGDEPGFRDQAAKVQGQLSSAETIVTPCPACALALGGLYKECGRELKARVMPLVEFVAARLDSLSIVRPDPRRAVYHDPCHLGRYLGIYEEPRRVLAAALQEPLLEFADNRDRANCCGGGGGLAVVVPDTARAIAVSRVAEAVATGADFVATACPVCRRMLGRSGREQGLVVEDVISVIARGLA